MNFYAYSRSNPVNLVDPSGELTANTQGASQEVKDQFFEQLSDLQQDVQSSPDIQNYFTNTHNVDINEVLSDPNSGPVINIAGGTNSEGFAGYNISEGDIDLYSNAYGEDQGNSYIKTSLIHELEHWANGGEYNNWTNWSAGQSWQTKLEVYVSVAQQENRGYINDTHGYNGYAAETVLYGDILQPD